jgi:hypothetical protein
VGFHRSTPLLLPHMLRVLAKSSETRAILLLSSGDSEHLWIWREFWLMLD